MNRTRLRRSTHQPHQPRLTATLTAVATAVALTLLAACGDTVSESTSVVNGGKPSATAATTSTSGTTACPSPAAAPVTAAAQTLQLPDGTTRSYAVWTPAAYAGAQPLPLLMLFHGTGGTPEKIAESTKLAVRGAERGYLVVAPQGTNGPSGDVSRWTVPGFGAVPDDVAFTRALLTEVESAYCVDPLRVYGTGFSSGGAFSQYLTCQAPELFAALAPLAGANLVRDCPSAAAVPWVTFHGTEDDFVAYDGMPNNSEDPNAAYFGAIEATTASMAARNGCAPAPVDTPAAPDVTKRTFEGCTAETVFYIEKGAGHTFPYLAEPPVGTTGGYVINDFDGAGTLLDFFDAHRRTAG